MLITIILITIIKHSPAKSVPARGWVIFLHGLNAHCCRPVHSYLAKLLSLQGYGLLALDFHGHGRSQGVRAIVEDYRELIDDALLAVLALHGETGDAQTYRRDERLLGVEHLVHNQNTHNLPFFLIGHSMGGGESIWRSLET